MICSYPTKFILLVFTAFLCLCPPDGAAATQLYNRYERGDSLKYGKRLKYLSDNQKADPLDRFVDSILRSYMQSSQNCGISIAVYKRGEERYYNYGEKKRGEAKLPGRQTIYEIGAMTNSFCGLLLAQAILEKKMKMEDDIRKYLPSNCARLSYKGRPLRISHLATHTAGFPRLPDNLREQAAFDSLNPFKNYSRKLLLEEVKTLILAREPGSSFEYSALGMALLGSILEQIYGQSFEDLVSEKICSQNRMVSTGITLTATDSITIAQGYSDDGLAVSALQFGDVPAIGALRSSSEDMLKYLTAALHTNELNTVSQKVVYENRSACSLAWFIKKTKEGNTLFWQNGGTAGCSAFCGFIPEKNSAFVLLGNSGTNLDYLGIAISNYMQK